ncbi:hypothetical protein E2C01_033751 [Portunus trituberculatus]|uniref:Secreted protein n=1 Tax=Portunus trituberculatus TaxID=210409 RepID=A0A5B7F3I7_PORTR|nr:hypothetical protein [Portunus trituberculatus]
MIKGLAATSNCFSLLLASRVTASGEHPVKDPARLPSHESRFLTDSSLKKNRECSLLPSFTSLAFLHVLPSFYSFLLSSSSSSRPRSPSSPESARPALMLITEVT